MLPTTLTACANDAAQQLAEPDSPFFVALCYANLRHFQRNPDARAWARRLAQKGCPAWILGLHDQIITESYLIVSKNKSKTYRT